MRNLNIIPKKVMKPQGKRARQERNRDELQKQPEDNKTTSAYPSIIMLNVNGLNYPTKSYRVAELIKKKTRPIHILPIGDLLLI